MNTKPDHLDLPPIPTAEEPPLKLVVDPEHVGIRLLMPILAIGGLILGFILGQTLTPLIDEALSGLCLALPLALILLVIFTQIGERVIKPRWSSGRRVSLNTTEMVFIDKRHQTTTFHWAKPVDFYGWYFPVAKRRTRVQRGWYCTALRLQQDEKPLTLYAFFHPDKTSDIPKFKSWFIQLRKRQALDEVKAIDPRLAAQITRLQKMETERWLYGGEISNQDFLTLMQIVELYGRYGFGN